MEIVGGAASIAQLAAYSRCAAQHLIDLYKATQDGPTFCQEQSYKVRLLQHSIQRIATAETTDSNLILPLFISIADQANILLKLLGQRGLLRNKWLWVIKGGEIEKAFQALDDKSNLLQLYLSERTYSIISNMNPRTATRVLNCLLFQLFEQISFWSNKLFQTIV